LIDRNISGKQNEQSCRLSTSIGMLGINSMSSTHLTAVGHTGRAHEFTEFTETVKFGVWREFWRLLEI